MKKYETCEVVGSGTDVMFHADNIKKIAEGWTPNGGFRRERGNKVQCFVREIPEPNPEPAYDSPEAIIERSVRGWAPEGYESKVVRVKDGERLDGWRLDDEGWKSVCEVQSNKVTTYYLIRPKFSPDPEPTPCESVPTVTVPIRFEHVKIVRGESDSDAAYAAVRTGLLVDGWVDDGYDFAANKAVAYFRRAIDRPLESLRGQLPEGLELVEFEHCRIVRLESDSKDDWSARINALSESGWYSEGHGHEVGGGCREVGFFRRVVDQPESPCGVVRPGSACVIPSDAACQINDRLAALERNADEGDEEVVGLRDRLDLIEKACDVFALDGPRMAVKVVELIAEVAALISRVDLAIADRVTDGASGDDSEESYEAEKSQIVAEAIRRNAIKALRSDATLISSACLASWNLVMPVGSVLTWSGPGLIVMSY